jgi:hypothetical protein
LVNQIEAKGNDFVNESEEEDDNEAYEIMLKIMEEDRQF